MPLSCTPCCRHGVTYFFLLLRSFHLLDSTAAVVVRHPYWTLPSILSDLRRLPYRSVFHQLPFVELSVPIFYPDVGFRRAFFVFFFQLWILEEVECSQLVMFVIDRVMVIIEFLFMWILQAVLWQYSFFDYRCFQLLDNCPECLTVFMSIVFWQA